MSLKFRNGSKHISQVGLLIDKNTDGNILTSENWEQFMTICDMINSTDDGPKDAVKAIRKRLNCKHAPSVMLALKLLETCVKNCGLRFHTCIATKDFMQDMVKVISPKHNPSVELQNTVLELIQTWACAFQSNPELKEVGKTYQELKTKGIEFPALDPDQASQVFISPKSAPPVAATEIPLPRAGRSSSNPMSPTGQQSVHRYSQSPPTSGTYTSSVMPPTDRVTKLRTELGAVQQNCRVFGELLTEVTNGENSAVDLELLEDLNATCRQMQARIVDLIGSVQNEQITEELLTANDELNNVFLRYDRYQRLRAGRDSAAQMESAHVLAPPAYEETPVSDTRTSVSQPSPSYQPINQRISGGVPVANLIDLGFDTPSNTAAPSSGGASGSLPPYSSMGADNNRPIDRETEIEEMEKWLAANPKHGEEESSATSFEFNQFMSERVRDSERLPANDGSNRANQQQSQQYNNELFSL